MSRVDFPVRTVSGYTVFEEFASDSSGQGLKKALHAPATKPRYSRTKLFEFGGEGLLERGAAKEVWIH
jgi:hypothetical protein